MTYNVHRCTGLDGKVSPQRIARVIARFEPDVIALQELDAGQARTSGVDQAAAIAERLRMSYRFHPVIALAQRQYGNAVLSRYPLRLVRAAQLPQLGYWPHFEPRGALWVAVDFEGFPMQVINCHLSIWPHERLLQMRTLLGEAWLGDSLCRAPVVLCGDLNAPPGSAAYRRLARRLRDAQSQLPYAHARQTYFSRYPISRIDHVFTSADIAVKAIAVPATLLDQKSSDHLPLVVDLALPETQAVKPV